MGTDRALIAPEVQRRTVASQSHSARQACILNQLVHAIDAEGSFARQQRVPFLARKVCLKPKHTKNARGVELSQALFEARCDEVQRYGSISY